MLSLLKSSNIPFNKDTDTLIGIYLVGWRPEWDSDGVSLRYRDIMASLNYTLCLVPYNGQFPVKPYGLNPLDLLDLKSRVKALEESTVPTDVSVLTRYLNTQMNSQGKGIEIEYSISRRDGYYVYTFSKLVINGCVLAKPSAPVSKEIEYQWRESNPCICIYTTASVLTNAFLHSIQWGIERGYPHVDNEAELWDGSFDKSSMTIPSKATLVAVFEISSPNVTTSVLPGHAYSLLNNEKVDGLTRAILGLFRYTFEKSNTGLDTSVEQTTSGSGDTRLSRLTVDAHYHNGVAVFDLTEIMFSGCPSFKSVAVNVTDLLTAKDSRWGPILTQIAKKYKKYSSGTYGYGPYMQKYGDTAYYIEIYPNLFTASDLESFRVIVSGNNGTSVSDLRAYKVQLTFVVGDVGKNTITDDARLLLACINNPFKSNY